MAKCWLSFEDGDRGHEVMYDCELDLGHDGPHQAPVFNGSMSGTLTFDVNPGYTISRGREGEAFVG